MSKKIILLIDDDADDCKLFSDALVETDPTTIFYNATNGRDAFKVLEKINTPDVIFLDINMPVMNGWECLDKLKKTEAYLHIPVIMYSTSTDQKEMSIAAERGALHFISKPYNYLELKRTLDMVVSKLHSNELHTLRGK
ncbi:MAG: response regulator [Bacteroidia bacterium]